jgi:spore germination cell wall hydrolase CwlJ-like protein
VIPHRRLARVFRGAAGCLLMAMVPAYASNDRAERLCLALVAEAEAAIDGDAGMRAVMRVMANRVRDPRFPASACAVALEPGQFQPVSENAILRRALEGAARLDVAPAERLASRRPMGATALALAESGAGRGPDPTGGALYFVNPALMDPSHCPWFATLRRTATIGSHVFMTDSGPAVAPALDCATVARTRRFVTAGRAAAPTRLDPILRRAPANADPAALSRIEAAAARIRQLKVILEK